MILYWIVIKFLHTINCNKFATKAQNQFFVAASWVEHENN